LSRLYKGYSVRLDSEHYLYNVPTPDGGKRIADAQIADAPHQAPPARENWNAFEAEQRRQAQDMLRDAEQACAVMRAQAELEAEQLNEKARQEGYRKGYEQGRFQAHTENEKALDELQELMGALDRGKDLLFQQHEQHLIDLALDIARKVVADRIEQDSELFGRIFKKAVEGLSGQKIVRLTVAEHEIQFATAHAEYLRSMIQDAEKLEFRVLENAAPGTLIVDTEDVVIDASVQKQMDVLEQAVQDARYERNT
jgi:flagellar assembly protein FliH